MQKKGLKIIAVIMIVSCLFSCKSNYNLSKNIECLGVIIPVEEESDFDVASKSNKNYLFQDDDLNLSISIEKFQYSTDVPEFKDMSSKFKDDFNEQREQETIVNNEDAIVLMDKDLKSNTNHDDGTMLSMHSINTIMITILYLSMVIMILYYKIKIG